VLEGDEVFDSSMLRQTVESMIATGKRNICVDLSLLDYLYSDTINALIVTNRRMLDVMGRLSLLAPQPSVLDILKKSGVHNILKIFLDEGELLRTSEELMGMGGVAGVTPMPMQRPQSEFDDLRNEIGSAFEAPSSVASMPQAKRPQAPQGPGMYAEPPAYAPSQPPAMQRPSYVPPAQPQFAPPPPPGPAPRYAPPPLRPFEPAGSRPPARAYTPPPPPKPAPLSTGAETRRMPSVEEIPSATRQQPAAREEDLEQFEATLEKKASSFERAKRDRFDDDFDEIPKKKSLAPLLIGLVVLIVLAGGGYFGYVTFSQQKMAKKPTPAPAVEQPKPETVVPQLPVDSTQQAKADTAKPAAEKPEPAKPEAAPAPVKKSTPRVASTPRPRPRPVVTPRPEPEPEPELEPEPEPRRVASTPRVERTSPSNIEVIEDEPAPVTRSTVSERPRAATPIEPTPEPASGGEPASVFIASIPPVADIYMDGQLIGKTNISELKVTSGTHTLRFVKGDKEVTKQQTFEPGKNPSMMVRIQ
jgi:anti-anti-sigma factor